MYLFSLCHKMVSKLLFNYFTISETLLTALHSSPSVVNVNYSHSRDCTDFLLAGIQGCRHTQPVQSFAC